MAAVLAAAAAGTTFAGNGSGHGAHGGSGGGGNSQRSTSKSMGMSQSGSSKFMKSSGSGFTHQTFSHNLSSNSQTSGSKILKSDKLNSNVYKKSSGRDLNVLSNSNSQQGFKKTKITGLPSSVLNTNTRNTFDKTKKFDPITSVHETLHPIVKDPIKPKPIPIDPGMGNGHGPIVGGGGKPIPIDPGIGNGQSPKWDKHNRNHNHNWNNFYCYPWNKNYKPGCWYPNYGFFPPIVVTPGFFPGPAIYPYPRTSTNYVTVVSRTATPASLVNGTDLQLVDIKLLDNGRPEAQIGPRYRVSFRNVGSTPVDHEFNVSLVAATEMKLAEDLPQTITRVGAIQGNDINFVDLRLPSSVFQMATTDGGKTEFSKLLVFVDSYQEVKDSNRENNIAGLERNTVPNAE